jgi:plasmid stabilization system protein ParE
MPDKPELIWEPGALDDLIRLREFIAPHRPKAAANAARCIIQAANRLLDYPHLGHPMGNIPEFNELIIPFGRNGYILRYRTEGKKVVILRVWHTREDR